MEINGYRPPIMAVPTEKVKVLSKTHIWLFTLCNVISNGLYGFLYMEYTFSEEALVKLDGH